MRSSAAPVRRRGSTAAGGAAGAAGCRRAARAAPARPRRRAPAPPSRRRKKRALDRARAPSAAPASGGVDAEDAVAPAARRAAPRRPRRRARASRRQARKPSPAPSAPDAGGGSRRGCAQRAQRLGDRVARPASHGSRERALDRLARQRVALAGAARRAPRGTRARARAPPSSPASSRSAGTSKLAGPLRRARRRVVGRPMCGVVAHGRSTYDQVSVSVSPPWSRKARSSIGVARLRADLEGEPPAAGDRVLDHVLVEQLGGVVAADDRHDAAQHRSAGMAPSFLPAKSMTKRCASFAVPRSRRVATTRPPGGRVGSSPYQYMRVGERRPARRASAAARAPSRRRCCRWCRPWSGSRPARRGPRPSRRAARPRRSGAARRASRDPGSGRSRGRAGSGRSPCGFAIWKLLTCSVRGLSSGRHSHSPLAKLTAAGRRSRAPRGGSRRTRGRCSRRGRTCW